MCSIFCKEITTYGHFIAFRHILFQYRIIIDTFRQEIVASGDHFVAVFKLDVHNNLCLDFLHINNQLAVFFSKEITAYSHFIAFWYILLQYRIVLDSFRYEVVTSGYHFISVFELNIHDHIFFRFVQINFQFAAFFCQEITAYGHYITFRHILL